MNLIEDKQPEQKMLKDTYKLPDGTVIDLGLEKIRAPEILFQPSRMGLEFTRNNQQMRSACGKRAGC